MIKKIKKYIMDENIIAKGDSIVVGVSGGADSVCLLLLLCALKKEYDLTLQVVHMNHQLREAAKEEEAYVVRLCKKQKVPCYVKYLKVKEYAKEQKLSLEEAARHLRYEEFHRWINEKGFHKIAVAHHMNDQAETFLFRVARGTGYVGMQGMKPKSDAVIRPLLCVTKEEILFYLREQGMTWMEDESNQDNTYARNQIRNEVIPAFQKVNDKVVEHIAQLTDEMRGLTQFAEEILRQRYEDMIMCKDATYSILLEDLKKESPFVQKHMMKRMMESAAGRKKDIGKIHVQGLLSLVDNQVGKQVSLPYDLVGYRIYDSICVEVNNGSSFYEAEKEIGELRINLTNPQKQGKKDCTQIIDYDRIKDKVTLRYREEGDFFVFHRDGSKKSLQRFFIDQKVPRKERDRIPVVADGKNIIWIVGMRLSEYYKVTQNTQKICELQYLRGKDHE